MKRIRKSAIALMCVAGLALVSCTPSSNITNPSDSNTSESTPSDIAPSESTPSESTPSTTGPIDMKDDDVDLKFTLQRLIVDTKDAKLVYYLGDKIDLSQVKVTARYVRYNPKYETKDELLTSGYYFDTKDVDMTTTGVKRITVHFRDGIYTAENYVDITVKSSVLETAGIEYLSGIECDVDVQEYLLNSTFKKPVINLKAHYFTGTKETNVKTLRSNKTVVECEYKEGDTLDKIGDFLYKISCTETLEIDGKPYENKVTTFIVIHVKNDVTNISFASGETTLSASAKGLDFSSWKLNVTREVGGTTLESFNPDEYIVRSVNSLVPGDYEGLIEHKVSGKTAAVNVKVVESTTENIIIGDKFEGTRDASANQEGIIYLDANKVFFTKNATKLESKVASYGDLEFDTRISIKNNGLFGINMSSAGTIVVYIASSGDEIREINFLNSDLEPIGKTFYTSGTKQLIKEYTVEVTEAGVYYFQVPSSGYVHGAIVSTKK